MASALAASHEVNIIHRDIKPANVLMTSTLNYATAKVADFDEGKELNIFATVRLTQQAVPPGTAGYMAPEVTAIRKADKASDVYSLGATAVSVLLYDGNEQRVPVMNAGPVRLPDFGSGLEANRDVQRYNWDSIFEVLLSALNSDPACRPSAAEMAVAFSVRRCVSGLSCLRANEDVETSKCGLLCASGEHFTCRECIVDGAAHFAETLAEDVSCNACHQPFSNEVLAQVLTLSSLTRLVEKRRQLAEDRAREEGNRQGQRFASANLMQQVVDSIAHEIENEVMTFTCPRCLRDASLFNGCLALECVNPECLARFCGVCRFVPQCTAQRHNTCPCSRLVHDHCPECAYNPVRGNVYGRRPGANDHAAVAEIEAGRNRWRKDELQRKIASVGEMIRQAVERDARIQQYKREVGL